MKKYLLFLAMAAMTGFAEQATAQCNGASVTITNFTISPNGNTVNYAFDWSFVRGNASIQVVDSSNGTWGGNLSTCIPYLKDSAAGLHHVVGSFNTLCNGVYKVAVLIWTNNNCGGTNCEAVSRIIQKIPLPVTFKSFSATRNHQSISIKWETASESNNSGFAVERNTSGSWQQVAWVPSLAVNGTSDMTLSYYISDLNDAKGMSQYRIRQVDMDGKAKYSDIRSVRGEAQIGKIIAFPNPTSNGKINVSFEDASTARNISIIDINGRTVKEIDGYMNNSIVIDNLQPGLYTLKVAIPQTGEQAIQKIVVNKR